MILSFPLGIISSILIIPLLIQPQFFSREPVYQVVIFYGIYYTLAIIIGWLYFGIMTCSSKQATVGKMALGIVVTDMNGRRLSFARSSARYFATFISDLTFCIGYLMIIWTKKKQSLHDMVAGTLVVRKR
jgi:uncharacterized RDD family membrane protein YckC